VTEMSEYSERTDGQRTNLLAALGVVVAAVLAAWGTFGEDDYDAGEYFFVLGIILVAAAIVFGLAVRRWAGATTALVLGVLAILTIAVFWTGLPPVLAAGAIALGLGLHQRGDQKGTIAVGLGVLAVVADLVVYVLDMT
jgi:ATP/ADP translocase